MLKTLTYIIIGASLSACSLFFEYKPKVSFVEINSATLDTTGLSFLVAYQDTIREEFQQVIARTPEPLLIARPGSNLMNWCADAVISSQLANKKLSEPVICLLNTGGLRASFGTGDLTRADFFKLMPFDNKLVWVHLPTSKLNEVEKYLLKSGGEPIANCTLTDQHLNIPGLLEQHQYIWVLTSDFLANGGDQMSFFLNETKEETNILLRDIFITVAKQQQVLILDAQPRITK